ncbi:sigma-54 dependent transcriptional regulator [Geobacter sp. SVR]|uniref:sigma-54-dependent transcriptional regulator n=1 Tax=Geobacter sp. SVR TaxID=2495594 RepID=UPI00143EFC1D|nr:sigma-54 dependent transcriptional regulator [Geobacter sp. SVR]BCS55088.1 sigma-54-dependent Fis family transcriptional regulator [Geobacter sp. SVR]GCF85269.1 sigma-54-dependent Fis family transcriptional regulator [Geobacter sp. SVR]
MDEKAPVTILYVEDEPALRARIRIVLEMHFARVVVAANGKEGLDLFSRELPDVVVSDIMMPIMDGLDMARSIREIAPETPVILTTAFTETGYLLKAIELGVSAYVRKPLDCRQLVDTVMRAATPHLQRVELEKARRHEQASLELLLGESPAMLDVIRQAQRIAETDFSVIIQGETGGGKSHLAALIHGLSRRRHHPFVTVTVGSMPEPLVESQLFGHVKGAFTGATSAKRGLFEEAHGGTLFFDDIDCASPSIQAKILHAVEEKLFFPVGGTRQVAVDTRIIAASNRDLRSEVSSGSFREDLYYRLGDLMITLPPLRERGNDIAVLAQKFLNEVSLELNRIAPRMSPDAILQLHRHSWPGNVRELKSAMKRAALFAGETVTGQDMINVMSSPQQVAPGDNSAGVQPLEELKRHAVREALAATGGKKMEAARLLEVDYSSFKRMLARYNL